MICLPVSARKQQVNISLWKLDLEFFFSGETEKKTVMADKAKITSLESSGAKMGHRYKKFTKAKDLTKASAKDMEVNLN